ncbi:MAG: four helix bundle protein [Patescibacteria group bacterium]
MRPILLKVPPPRPTSQPKLIPVVLKLKDAYGLWQKYLADFPKQNRYTLGSKIDDLFLTSIEYCFLASYASKDTKIGLLDRAISRVDLLKLLLQLAWEVRALDSKKYVHLGERLVEVGRMLGGWRKGLLSKTPTSK